MLAPTIPLNSKAGKLFMKIFLTVGLVSLAAGLFFYSVQKDKAKKLDSQVTGTVVDFSRGGFPVLEYTVDGNTYRFTAYQMGNGPRSIGDTETVRYSSETPAQGRTAGINFLLPVLLLLQGGFVTAAWLIVKLASLIFPDREDA